ncbi:MAG: SDR family oxidoreductase [Longimicrobiales bacterium]|nr:SDR family oxidoreductase [Longimicrobiales bacterium]
MPRPRTWPRSVAATAVGVALGAGALAAGALLLYGGDGLLSSAGLLIAFAVAATAAGLWVGAPGGPLPGHRRIMGRWMIAIAAMVIASFAATFWLRSPSLQASPWGPPVAVVLLLAEPAYAVGALLAALEARRRGWLGHRWYAARQAGAESPVAGVAVPALLGTALGVVLAASWLIPAYPPGPLFLGLALLLTLAGSLEMGLAEEPKEGTMSDRVVIVTGVGDRGQVGFAVAEAFVGEGARVVVTGRTGKIEDHARELGDDVVGVEADLADADGAAKVVDAVRERWGRLDVLVNVAGGLHVMKSVADTSPEEWQREVDANVRTAFLMTRAALPLLRDAKGAIINFAAPSGLRATSGMAAYNAAKAGVVALTRSTALEEKEHGVRVNAIAPGIVDTAQNREEMGGDAVEWVEREEIVSAVVFLAGDVGSGVNGETIRVQGRQI